jgi:ABC-type Fe3+ transport system permease subunit
MMLPKIYELFSAATPCVLKDSVMGFPTWYKYLEGYKAFSGDVCSPFAGQAFEISKLNVLAGIGLAVIEILLRIVAMVTVAFVAYGGFEYLISQGEPDKIQSAKNTILNAFIGLAIALLATVLVNFIGKSLM